MTVDASRVRVPGPLAPYADGFRAQLAGLGHSRWSQVFHLQLMAHVSRWLEDRCLDAAGLTDAAVAWFVRDRRDSGHARFRGAQGLAPLLGFLRDAGAAPSPAVVTPDGAAARLAAGFAGYLTAERGLAPGTAACYSAFARQFLASLPGHGHDDPLAGLTAAGVRAFVIAESGRRGTGSLKNAVTAVRALLRFLHLRGLIAAPLDGAVPAAAGWHRPPLTRPLRPGDVAAVLASCDRGTPAGRRDYAVLLLLARLGLRAGEAAGLRAGDVDWRAGEILVRGKGGRHERLPLPADVGEALADYCQHARPRQASSGMLLLHARAPYGRLTPSAVSHVVVRACRRAGLEPAGAHQLRHAAATSMRRAGAPLAEISQVLRHRHIATTARYGSIDPGELAVVAGPWPGSAS